MAQTDSWYDRNVLPLLLDVLCGVAPIARQRHKVIPRASGRVLEIGIGTGLNLAHYDRSKVRELVGIDPAGQMHRLAQRRSKRAGLSVDLRSLSAERLPFAPAAFDCVVCTYTLCSIPDPVSALAEMRRVLRPDGAFLFAEHGLAPDAEVARWQTRLEPFWSKMAGGCHLTRDIPLLIREAGFAVEVESAYITRPRPFAFNYWGVATPV